MPGYKDPPKNGVKFGQGQDPTKGGRPKKIETLLKEHFEVELNLKLTKSQINQVLAVIMSKSKDGLKSLSKDDDMPWWISMIFSKMEKDTKKGSIELFEKLYSMVFKEEKEAIDRSINITFTTDPTDEEDE